jgi:hypothetical protein
VDRDHHQRVHGSDRCEREDDRRQNPEQPGRATWDAPRGGLIKTT